MTKIYRVEHKTKPFWGTVQKKRCPRHWLSLPRPVFFLDVDKHVCGTTSLKAFRKWFPKKVLTNILAQKTHKVFIFDAPVEYRDEVQVVFDRTKAKVIGELLPCGKSIYF